MKLSWQSPSSKPLQNSSDVVPEAPSQPLSGRFARDRAEPGAPLPGPVPRGVSGDDAEQGPSPRQALDCKLLDPLTQKTQRSRFRNGRLTNFHVSAGMEPIYSSFCDITTSSAFSKHRGQGIFSKRLPFLPPLPTRPAPTPVEIPLVLQRQTPICYSRRCWVPMSFFSLCKFCKASFIIYGHFYPLPLFPP